MTSNIRSPFVIGLVLAALALVYRLLLLHTTLSSVDSDQAVLGLMARHILHGDHPVFFYGQSYQGALEAYLTAAVFALWGQSDLTLRLIPTFTCVLFVVQLYVLALRLYGQRVAVVTGLWLAVPAPVLVYWGTVAGAGYVEVMVAGTGLFLIATRRWGLAQPRRYDLAALGLLTGLGLWLHPVILYYLATLALCSALPLWRRRPVRSHFPASRVSYRHAWPMVACFTLGAAPLLGYTLRHGSAVLSVISRQDAPILLGDVALRLAAEALPVLTGAALPSTMGDQFVAYINGHTLLYALSLLLLGYLSIRLLVSQGGLLPQVRAFLAGRPFADAPLAVLPMVMLVLYLSSQFAALPWTTRNPRYLLPIYSATPYLVACAIPVTTRAAARRRAGYKQRLMRLFQDVPDHVRALVALYLDGLQALSATTLPLIVGAAIAVNIYGAAQLQSPPRITPLAAALLARSDTSVYSLYWLSWRLAFESGEQITPVVTQQLEIDTQPGGNRYPAYLAQAAHAKRWAYILPYDVWARELVQRLRRAHMPFNHWHWDNASVFDGPVEPSFPPRASNILQ